MVGFAWQQGGMPVSRAKSMLEAIRLNGVEVEMNIAAFEWGRRAAFDLAAAERGGGHRGGAGEPSLDGDRGAPRRLPDRLSEAPAMRERYRTRVEQIAAAEARVDAGRDRAFDARSRIRSSS